MYWRHSTVETVLFEFISAVNISPMTERETDHVCLSFCTDYLAFLLRNREAFAKVLLCYGTVTLIGVKTTVLGSAEMHQ